MENKAKIYVAGIGPGSAADVTPAVAEAIRQSDVVVGYKYYFQFIDQYLSPDTECVDTGMKKERERAEEAFAYAAQGKTVCVISSGDAGIYGMTPLIYEMQKERGYDVEVVALPGISAFQKAASLLGAPMGHDFCVISLSDLMTPWALIERRIKAAASADFVTAIYNPRSNGRYWQLQRLVELFLKERQPDTPVGYVRQAGREDEEVTITTLADFDTTKVDMFTIVIIGNSQTKTYLKTHPDPPVEGGGEKYVMVTPRGYYRQEHDSLPSSGRVGGGAAGGSSSIGQDIMIQSFRTIRSELCNPDIPLWRLWPMLHAVHTTADFDMERLLWMDDEATANIYNKVKAGQLKTIVTDVTMVASGIRKGALQRLGIEVVCYINDPRGAEMAKRLGITRAQAGMRLAAEEHPDALYAFGNAPTALLELCDLVRKRRMHPAGIVGAPVGFVHVEESKHAAKTLQGIPKIIIEGRKGGSNLAATLVNSILTYDDASLLLPGRDV